MSVFFGSRKSGFFWVIFCALYPFFFVIILCVVLVKIRFCSLKKTFFASERQKREREEGQRDEERFCPIEKSFCYILLFIYRVFRQGETRIYY